MSNKQLTNIDINVNSSIDRELDKEIEREIELDNLIDRDRDNNNRHEPIHRKLQRAYQEKNLMLARIQYYRKQVNQSEKLQGNESEISRSSPLSVQTDDNDKESWNRLLEANIRAGTIACLWCLKTLLIKKLSLAFHRWKYNTSNYIYYSMKSDNKSISNETQSIKSYKSNNVIDDNITSNNDELINVLLDKQLDNETRRELLLSYAKTISNPINELTTLSTNHLTTHPTHHLTINTTDELTNDVTTNLPSKSKSPRYLSPTISYKNQINPLVLKSSNILKSNNESHNESHNDSNSSKYHYINELLDKKVISYLSLIDGNKDNNVDSLYVNTNNLTNRSTNRSTSRSSSRSTSRSNNLLPNRTAISSNNRQNDYKRASYVSPMPNYLAPTRSSNKKMASPKNIHKHSFSRSMSLNNITSDTNRYIDNKQAKQVDKYVNKEIDSELDDDIENDLSELTNELNNNPNLIKSKSFHFSNYPPNYHTNQTIRSNKPSNKSINLKAKVTQWPPPNTQSSTKNKMTKAQYELIHGSSMNGYDDVDPKNRWIRSILRK